MQALGQDSALVAGATLSGIRSLLVAPFAVGRYTYADSARHELASLGPLTEWWAAVLPGNADGAGPVALASEQGRRSLQGWRFGQAIILSAPGLSIARRAVLEALRSRAAVIALAQDFSGQWWLYGQQGGLALAETKADTSPAQVAFSLTGIESEPARAVQAKVITTLFGLDASSPVSPSAGGTVELRTAGGRLLATIQAGQKIILKSGFKLDYTIL